MSDYYVERDGLPVKVADAREWAREFERKERKVAHDTLVGAEVSTVFLGLDHSYGEGPPLIYETLVFGGVLDQEMDRYSTREEALAGHAAMVERVRGTSCE